MRSCLRLRPAVHRPTGPVPFESRCCTEVTTDARWPAQDMFRAPAYEYDRRKMKYQSNPCPTSHFGSACTHHITVPSAPSPVSRREDCVYRVERQLSLRGARFVRLSNLGRVAISCDRACGRHANYIPYFRRISRNSSARRWTTNGGVLLRSTWQRSPPYRVQYIPTYVKCER
jgi:hypothetical protein